jgi:translation initiation factor 1
VTEIDPLTGLPKELGIGESITKESQSITVRTVKRRFGKLMTLIEGFEREVNIKEISKKLKSALACGGTIKNNVIELQGNHLDKVKEELIKYGFPKDSISIQR